jgi:hypothetical protein
MPCPPLPLADEIVAERGHRCNGIGMELLAELVGDKALGDEGA